MELLLGVLPQVLLCMGALPVGPSVCAMLAAVGGVLIALAIGVAVRCDGCIGFHMQALLKLGASKAEIEETLGMAVYMGGGPSLMYAAHAMQAYDQMTAG